MSNIRLAHRWCNSHRQSRSVEFQDIEEYVARLAEAQAEYDLEKKHKY